MSTTKKIFFSALLLMLVALFGCRHEPIIVVGPCDDGYPLNYYFLSNGDTNILAVIITVSSFNQRVDSSYQVYQVYSDSSHHPNSPPYVRKKIDQPFYYPGTFNCFTPGSTKWMKVDIRVSDPDSAPNVFHRMEFVLSDTNWVKMFEPEDFTESFSWPEDTNRYVKITDYWVN